MKKKLCVLLCSAIAAPIFGARVTHVPFNSVDSRIMVKLLAEAKDLPEVREVGYRRAKTLDEFDAHCDAVVLRPEREDTEDNLYSENNRIECHFNYPDGARGELLFSLKTVPISYQGNIADARPMFRIQGPVAERFYAALEAAYDSGASVNPYLEKNPVIADGGESVEGMVIYQKAPEIVDGDREVQAIAVGCTRVVDITGSDADTKSVIKKVREAWCMFQYGLHGFLPGGPDDIYYSPR